mmetsp:Transcript_64792/g.173872  ORF Transcript_64792/g.173872 Transcript_64792/m.173872 type:complete len:260 (-) Transcript_64792:9532-10311(-)
MADDGGAAIMADGGTGAPAGERNVDRRPVEIAEKGAALENRQLDDRGEDILGAHHARPGLPVQLEAARRACDPEDSRGRAKGAQGECSSHVEGPGGEEAEVGEASNAPRQASEVGTRGLHQGGPRGSRPVRDHACRKQALREARRQVARPLGAVEQPNDWSRVDGSVGGEALALSFCQPRDLYGRVATDERNGADPDVLHALSEEDEFDRLGMKRGDGQVRKDRAARRRIHPSVDRPADLEGRALEGSGDGGHADHAVE